MAYNWISILGTYLQEKDNIVFKGGPVESSSDRRTQPAIGNYICDQTFGGGIISGEIEFLTSIDNEACEYILYYDPSAKAFVTAGLGGLGLCSIRTFTGNTWINHAVIGDKLQLTPKRTYDLRVSVVGSSVSVIINGVETLKTILPYSLPQGQTGLWNMGLTDIKIRNYKVNRKPGKVFVVMQFTPPYNELYTDVIVPVCKELELSVFRADETYGPGIIIADITREIVEANVIIADITPKNPNVYYEVGYAHALNKPTILIAETPTQLPFDVSPYRVLFYENTIGGKAKVESGLRKHLTAIQTQLYTR